jgi:hypothetical protein
MAVIDPRLPPSINAAALRRTRGFLEGRPVRLAWSSSPGDVAPEALAVFDSAARRITISCEVNGESRTYFVDVADLRAGPVSSMAFICPITRDSVRTLYFNDSGFVSRPILGFRYPSQDDQRLHRDQGYRPDRRPSIATSIPSSVWDTAHAIDRRREKPIGELPATVGDRYTHADELMWLANRDARLGNRPDGPGEHESSLPLETTPSLDIRVFRDRLCVADGEVRIAELQWPQGGPIQRGRISFDLRARRASYATIEWWGDAGEGRQSLSLVRETDRQRPRFRCPIRLIATDLVAFRNGWFASPSAQRIRRRPIKADGRS